MFVNTLVIRNKIEKIDSFIDFVNKVKQTTLEAYENQDYQFEELVENILKERDTSRNPIFNVTCNLLNQIEQKGDLLDQDYQNYNHLPGTSRFDLTLTAVDFGEQLLFNFDYSTNLFKPETIDRFIVYFKQIVSQLVEKPDIKISAIDILTEEEKHQLFEEQVEKTPDNEALFFNGESLTYRELNNSSNQIRIELGEIENALLAHKDVKEAVVLVNQNVNLDKELVAYINIQQDHNSATLRDFLKKDLPEYMIPSFFVQVEEFPLTQNGKIDKKALSKLKGGQLSFESSYVAPRNPIEESLVEIWEKIISRSKIGIADNFFSIGGSSLSIIKLHKLILQEFNVNLNVVDLFNNNTIGMMADLIKSYKSEEKTELQEEKDDNNILKF